MSYRMSNNGQDKEPCNSNDSLGYDLETGEPITEIIPCSTTTTTTTTTTTEATTTAATTTDEPTTTTATTTTTEEEPTTTTSTTTTSTTTTTATTTAEEPTTSTTSTTSTATSTTSSVITTEAPTTTTTTEVAVSDETGESDARTSSSSASTTTEATTTTATPTTTASNQRENENENNGDENVNETPASPQEKEMEVDSFYTCSINDQDVLAPPAGAIRLDLVYDYEVHISTDGSSSEQDAAVVMRKMENQMAYDLAEANGLVNCTVVNQARRTMQMWQHQSGNDRMNAKEEKNNEERMKKRRHLRKERSVQESGQERGDESAPAAPSGSGSGEVLAINAEPIDVSIADQYECQSQSDDIDTSSTLTCTPMRGYMTAWLAPDADPLVNEQTLLSLIKKGMQSGSYTTSTTADINTNGDSNPIVITKVHYLGPRDIKNDGVSSIEQGNGNGTDNAELQANGAPFLAIGFSVFFTALAMAALLGLYILRKRRRQDGLADGVDLDNGGVNTNTINGNRPPAVRMEDPDDIHLLPATEKFDMRSIHDDGDDESSTRTEDYEEDETYSDRSGSRRSDDDDTGSNVNRGSRDGVDKSTSVWHSSLAAMGMASTVVTNMGPASGDEVGGSGGTSRSEL